MRPFILLFFFAFHGVLMASKVESSITVTEWGSIGDRTIEKYSLRGKHKLEVDVVTYGATITAIRTLDNRDNVADIVLGFDNIEGYLSTSNPYFGATVGRVANRIAKAEFTLDGKKYRLAKNIGENSLHGGFRGWNSKIWRARILEQNRLVMSLLSEDGDEGYPGTVIASVEFHINDSGVLIVRMKAFADKSTPINLTNHSYFNLAGHGSNATEIYKHEITLNADRWTVTDSDSIPTGEIRPVDKTIMDLRNSTVLGAVINQVPGGGYDNNFCITNYTGPNELNFVGKVVYPDLGRYLKICSNQPGVQLYTANYLPEQGKTSGVRGKDGKEYFKHGAFCLETQNYPDAINQMNFPDSVVQPGELYSHIVTYEFGTYK